MPCAILRAMTTQVTNSYTPEQKAIALAAYERYGLRPAERFLEQVWGNSPTQQTILRWKADTSIEVTDAHRDVWADYDKAQMTEMKLRVPKVFNGIMDAIEGQLAEGTGASLQRVQSLSIAGGIWYDKAFPQARPGAAGGISVNGDGAQVVINLVEAPAAGEARPIREV